MKNIGLIMQYNLKLKLLSYISQNNLFLSFYKVIKMIIRGFKKKYLIFVIKIEIIILF